VSLVLWPFQLLEELINSVSGSPVTHTSQKTKPNSKKTARRQAGTSGDRFVDVMPNRGQNSGRPSIGVTISYESDKTNFVKQAQKLRNKEGDVANHIPFKCYWPTYGDMNASQQQWYFYWRAQARRGNFLSTDLSYIFVYVYETLNLVEVPDPIHAANRLRILWLAYRKTYSNLDNYLPEWGGDLLAVKADGAHALAWWENLLEQDGLRIPEPIINTIVEKAIRTNGLDHLSYKLWALLSDYQPKNKFYQKYNTDHFVDLAYEKAIRVANDFYMSTSKKSLIDQFVSDRIQNYEKRAFSSALIGFPYPSVVRLASGRDYAGSTRLASNITSIMKYAENILRKQLKFSAKLSGVEVSPDVAKQLDIAFQTIEPKPAHQEPVRITLDHDRVKSLQQESHAVSEMLATSQENTEQALLTDLEEVRALWKTLNNLERLVLAGLHNKELDTAPQIGQAFKLEAENVQSVLDAINKKALPILGDRMIYEDSATVSLAEDFIDELDVIVREMPPSPELASAESADTNLDPWMQFFDKLEPVEVEITKILGYSGRMEETELDSIARAHNAMGNAVMDSLNEKAQEHLSHLPFYPEGGYWLVEEDDLPILQQHLGLEVN